MESIASLTDYRKAVIDQLGEEDAVEETKPDPSINKSRLFDRAELLLEMLSDVLNQMREQVDGEEPHE